MANESITKSEALRRIAESTKQIGIAAAKIKIKTNNSKLQLLGTPTGDVLPDAPGS